MSGINFISDSSIDFHPAIDDPSNINPPSRKSSSTSSFITVTCCKRPRGSVNLISTYLMSSSAMRFTRSLALILSPFHYLFLIFYNASTPSSPVRIRIACSMLDTKILPSPILSVRAAPIIASITVSN